MHRKVTITMVRVKKWRGGEKTYKSYLICKFSLLLKKLTKFVKMNLFFQFYLIFLLLQSQSAYVEQNSIKEKWYLRWELFTDNTWLAVNTAFHHFLFAPRRQGSESTSWKYFLMKLSMKICKFCMLNSHQLFYSKKMAIQVLPISLTPFACFLITAPCLKCIPVE